MFGRRKVTAPDNATQAVVPVFTTDPHGAALFHGALNGSLGGGRVVIDTNSRAWHGPTEAPQHFRGAVGLGGGRASVPMGSTLDQERSANFGSVEAIFGQRGPGSFA